MSESMRWGRVLAAGLFTLAGLLAGVKLAPHFGAGGDQAHSAAAKEPARFSAATLRNLGVTFGVVQLSDWTRTVSVAAVVEAPPQVMNMVYAPFGGRVLSVEVALGDEVRPGSVVATVLRDPLPRPELLLTGAVLKPASELHETVLELRARVQELELARTELTRVEQFTVRVDDEDLPIIPLQRKIDLQYRVVRAEAAVEQSRMEMEKHGLDAMQVATIEAGGHMPQASGATWRRALEHNGIWTVEAEALFVALPPAMRDVPWVVATIGELAGVGLASAELRSWLDGNADAGGHFLEIGVLLQRGHTLEDVRRLHALGALEPIMHIAAPATDHEGEAWDVHSILVQPGAHLEAGAPLVGLKNPAHMLLRVEAVGGEIAAVLNAKSTGAELRATTLVPGAGPDLAGLRVAFVTSSEEGDTVAYVEVENSLLSGKDDRRTWGMRRGMRYTVEVPRETHKNVIVLPADAVAELGPDRVVFHYAESGDLHAIPLIVAYRDEQVVIVPLVPELELAVGDEIAMSGAFALSLALQSSGDNGGDGHGHAH